ncbi:transposase family protein [Streptomyces sp. NPDC008139]|uniref:transposase family protein n=1 Tax=Streptomyces sp. NPDC008139 TaxID=3364814 RepID=UPI0036E48D4C
MEEVVLRLEELLFPSIADVAVLSVDVNDEAVHIVARSTVTGAVCPDCGSWSRRIHSSYLRFPADVPSGGRRVALCLRVRRFLCPVISCGRRTFVEQLSGLTRRYGRRTERLRSTLASVGLALAGRAGARLARVFGVPVSRSTVLRLVEALPDPQVPAPRVVGVDEYATRKGRYYGTILVDVGVWCREGDMFGHAAWRACVVMTVSYSTGAVTYVFCPMPGKWSLDATGPGGAEDYEEKVI